MLFLGLLPLFVLAHFGHHVVGALLTPLIPMIRSDLALNYIQVGVLLSVFGITSGFSQLPGGWLADRVGTRTLVAVGISGVALAGLLVGLSQTYIMLIVFLVLMAVVGGGYHPAAIAAISASVEPKNRGRALGTHFIGGSTSHFIAPLAAAAIALAWGWRGSYIAISIPFIVLGIVIYVLLGRKAYAQKTEHSTNASDNEAPPAKETEPRITGSDNEAPLTSHRWRYLVVVIILSTLQSALIHDIAAFVPLYAVDHFGVSEEAAAALVSLLFVAGFLTAPLGGYLSDRLGRIPVMLAVSFIAGPVLYLLNVVPYGLGFYALLVAIGAINFIRMPVSEAYIVSEAPERRRSTILGIYFFATREVSGLTTPVLGYLIERIGFRSSFTIISAALVAGTLACSVFLWGSRD